MKKLLFIYNPHAGKGLIKGKLTDILDIFVRNGYEITIAPTQGKADAIKLARDRSQNYDLIVCSGGDGTLDEVVTGMMQSFEKIPVGYIPAGSTNDFANSLRIPKQMLEAASLAVKGDRFACDIGSFNEKIFVYIAAFGVFTDVSYRTKQEIKNVLGHSAYILEGVKRLHTIKAYHVRVEHDGEELEDDFIFGMVTNTISVGGFKYKREGNVILDDGLFEVLLIKKPGNPLEFQEIVAAMLLEQVDSSYMYTFKTNHLKFTSEEEIAWTLDGEYGGEQTKAEILNNPHALEIMVDRKKLEEQVGKARAIC